MNFKSFLLAQNHAELPKTEWQSCGFLPFLSSQQGYVKFNSRRAAYNSSSLGANTTGGPDFPGRNKLATYSKVSQRTSPFPFLLIMCNESFQNYYFHHNLFLYKSKSWGDRHQEIKISSETKYTGRRTIHPPEHFVIPRTASVNRCHLQMVAAWMSSLALSGGGRYQINTGQEMAGWARNKRSTNFFYSCDNLTLGGKYWEGTTNFHTEGEFLLGHLSSESKESQK